MKQRNEKKTTREAVKHSGGRRFAVKSEAGAKEKKYGASYYVGFFARLFYRIILIAVTVLLLAVFAVWYTINTIAHGPSETIRNALVLSAMQASATKWVPGLFLDDETVDKIVNSSQEKIIEEVDVPTDDSTNTGPVYVPEDQQGGSEAVDISDGIEFHFDTSGTFRAYVMIIHDPSKVFVGVSSNDFPNAVRGQRIYDAAEKYKAIAAINGGEFHDPGGEGLGNQPFGLTYSKGKCVWNDGKKRTFIGIDNNNRLIVEESMTKAKADALGIRDAVSFQTGNVLIKTEDGVTKCYFADGNNGKAQRTAIGQRADGKFIFLVTDGRSASSLGADYNDVINMMLKYGAINAGMLDGGSSAMMYYKNYITKYKVDENDLDEYQKLGLVNKYKAFTRPRYLPTFFMVAP